MIPGDLRNTKEITAKVHIIVIALRLLFFHVSRADDAAFTCTTRTVTISKVVFKVRRAAVAATMSARRLTESQEETQLC